MRDVLAWIGWVGVSFTAAASGLLTDTGPWYAGLTKPAWTPPPWLFGPVWTTLYLLMGNAAWLVWRRRHQPGAWAALGVFLLQLAFNAAWTPLFFGAHRVGWALADLGALWLALVWTVVLFARQRPLAAGLLGPYLIWTTYALALNVEIWRLN